MSLTYRSLSGPGSDQIEQFSAETLDPARWRADLARCFAEGSLLPQWCWQAFGDDGRLRAAHYWWGWAGASTPHQLVSVERRDVLAAAALVEHSRTVLGLRSAKAILSAPGAQAQPARTHPEYAELLARTGFRIAATRVQVQWGPDGERPSTAGGLTMTPARARPEPELVSLVMQVLDGSLDHAMRDGVETIGPQAHAQHMVTEFLTHPGSPEWFTVGLAPDGTPAGYVLPATIDGRAVLAEVGVARAHRGRRHSDQLLAHATALLADAGFDEVRGVTDEANVPMRAAFARAGFGEVGRRSDHVWVREVDSAAGDAGVFS
jgi:ribosomal protein S18 acetylase RimI-like enzyme